MAGIILGALGGIGDATQDIAKTNTRLWNEQNLAQLNSDLAQQKMMALESYKNDLANAPMNRAGTLIGEASNTQIPIEPEKVTELDQSGAERAGLTTGLQGDIAKIKAMRDAAQSTLENPNATPEQKDQAQGLISQIYNQVNAQADIKLDEAAGKTRTLTPPEALQAAAKKALQNGDGQAYAALKKLQQDKYIPVPYGGVLDTESGEIKGQQNYKTENVKETEAGKDRRATDKNALLERQAEIKYLRDHSLTPEQEVNARAIANGQLPALTGMSARSPGAAMTMARVLELNPNYNANEYKTKSKAEQNFADGKLGNQVRSFNVSILHLNSLQEFADALNNGDTPMVNKIGNIVAAQTGKEAPVDFDAAKHIVADEVVKAIIGGATALGDREAAAKVINNANSPEQLRGVIETYKHLMAGQLTGIEKQYNVSTGKTDFAQKYLMPDTLKIFKSSLPATPPPSPKAGDVDVPNPFTPPSLPPGWSVEVR